MSGRTNYQPPRQSPLAGRHPAKPQPSAAPLSAAEPPAPPTPSPLIPARTKVTYNISTEVADLARDAFWVAHAQYRSLSDWVEDALRRQIEATKAEYGLQELPRRPGPLPTGRPLN